MNSPEPLIQPEECTLLLIDQQAGLAFGGASIDRQVLLNNVIALAKTAAVFKLPVIVSTSASKVYSGPLMPAIQAVLPGIQSIERRNMNIWEDEAVRSAVRLGCRQRLNQAALAGLARKARTPSMKASICGSVPMVTRHQFS